METLAIIVPCYNEQEALPLFYKEASKVLEKLNYDYKLLLINDGSKDNTLSIMKSIAEKDEHVKYLSFSRNFGKEAAMYAGFCNANADYVCVMDADMQDPPSLLPEMLEILHTQDYDSVATRRKNREGEPPIRSWFAHRFYEIINKISDADIVDGARDFRLMKREMVEAIVSMTEYNRFSKGIFGWIGFKTKWLPYKNVERVAGETKWSFKSLFKYAITGITSFSITPLRFLTCFGLVISVVAFLLIVFTLIRKLAFGIDVSGYASLLIAVLFLGGIIELSLGILGEYIANIYLEAKDRPIYIIQDTNIKESK